MPIQVPGSEPVFTTLLAGLSDEHRRLVGIIDRVTAENTRHIQSLQRQVAERRFSSQLHSQMEWEQEREHLQINEVSTAFLPFFNLFFYLFFLPFFYRFFTRSFNLKKNFFYLFYMIRRDFLHWWYPEYTSHCSPWAWSSQVCLFFNIPDSKRKGICSAKLHLASSSLIRDPVQAAVLHESWILKSCLDQCWILTKA